MKTYTIYRIKKSLLFLIVSLFLMGCEDFLEVDGPGGQIPKTLVFEDEATATAAVTSIYAKLRDDILLTGNLYGMTTLMGLYADELDYYADMNSGIYPYYSHEILADNEVVRTLWNGSYEIIYMSNLALEGLESATDLSDTIKRQLKGELLFLRALTHFYLLNLHADLPYVITTDYLINQDTSRLPMAEVYDHIVADLMAAKDLLTDEYVALERTRANRFVVSAFLARVYLYMERWEDAIAESTLVISNTGLYELESLENEFLKESSSAILQFKPKNAGDNTHEAISFYFIYGPPYLMSLSPSLVSSFEPTDLRLLHWIRTVTDGSDNWYAPFKYKEIESTGSSLEYSMVFRLAEQYLIRSEARLKLGDLSGATSDLNTIRNRAGLTDYEGTTPLLFLDAILLERRHEFFTEYGHRWFDLKRMDKADAVLMGVKPHWQTRDVWFPIPDLELSMNPNLLPQNTGY